MARTVLANEINGETPREDLEFCILEAERTRHPDVQQAAARATIALAIVTAALVIVTAILAAIAAIPLFRP